MASKFFDWKSTDAQVRFLDDPAPTPFVQWIPLFKVVVPPLDVDLILDHEEPDYLGSGPRVMLKPEVKQWCIDNLRGNMAYPKVIKSIDQSRMETIYTYYVDFRQEHDAILFKLRWIG